MVMLIERFYAPLPCHGELIYREMLGEVGAMCLREKLITKLNL